jgi:hypothetical protein
MKIIKNWSFNRSLLICLFFFLSNCNKRNDLKVLDFVSFEANGELVRIESKSRKERVISYITENEVAIYARPILTKSIDFFYKKSLRY